MRNDVLIFKRSYFLIILTLLGYTISSTVIISRLVEKATLNITIISSITLTAFWLILIVSLFNKIPYLCLTSNECFIFPSLFRNVLVINWKTICSIDFFGKTHIHLSLDNGRIIKILLSQVKRKDRERMISELYRKYESAKEAESNYVRK